jgi:HPr kinase/phosphorylase
VSAANIHASAVAFGPMHGVLILGAPGSGKSRLALALIAEGAQLVADDQVFLARDGDALFARAPRTIEGLIEVRGLGILRLAFRRLARLVLAVDMDAEPARLPQPSPRPLAGVALPCLPGRNDTPFAAALARYVCGQRESH